MSNNINFLKKKTVLNDILSNRNVSVINNTKYDPNDENDKGLLLNTINNAETNTDKYIISYDNVDLNISYNDIKELYRSKSWLSNNQVSFDEFKDNVNYYNNYNKNGIQNLTYAKYDQSLNTNTLLIDNTYNSLYYVRPDKINLMSYSIKNKDGFNYDENNHVLKFNIDNNYIKSINNLLYYNYNNIRNTSSDKTGIASIDDKFFDVKNYNNSYSNNILTINKEFKTEIYSTLNKIKNLYNDCKVIYNKEKTSQTIDENGENNKIGGININNTEIRFEDPKLYYDDDVVGVNSLDLSNANTLYVFDLDNADFRLGYTDTLDYDYKENQYTSNASANSLSNDVKNSTLKNRISLTLSENDASANIIANQHIKSNHVIGTTYNIDLGDISKNSFNANGLSILYKASPYKISTEDSGQLITIPYDKELNIRKIAGTFGKYFYTTEIERIAEYLFVSSHYDIKGFRIPDSSFNYLKSRNTITDIFNLQYYSVLKAGYGYPEVYPILNLYPNNYINEKYFDSDLISYYDENNNTVDSEIIATEDELSTCVSKIRDIYLDDVKCLYFYKLLHKDGYYETVGEPNMLIFEEDIDSYLTFIARNDVQFTFTVPVGCEDNAKYIQFSLDGVTWEYLIDNTIKKDNNNKIIDKGVIYKKYTYINNLNDSNNGKIRSESNIKIIKTNNFEYSKIENKNEYIYRGENGFGDNQPDNIKYIIQTTNNITYITIVSINNLIINLQNELRNDPENNEKIEKLNKLNNALNDGFIYEKTEKNQYNIIINETFIKDFNEHIENINDENVVTYNSILHNDITHITYTLNHTIENSNKILWRAKFYNFKLSDDHKYIEDIKDNNDNLSINDKPYYVYSQYDYITATPNLANGIGTFGATCLNGEPKFEIFGNSMSLIYGCPYIEYVDEISNEKTNVYCTKLSDKPHIFDKLFSGSYIVSAKRLALPATSLEKSNFCYQEMFLNCDHLTDSPKLPAEILADRCYKGMFKNCIALQSAPRLDALTMKPECYKEMFRGCEALLMPPNVTKKYPTGIFMSKELAYGCYESMFEGCVNLRVMPQLTASKMKENCYKKMFKGCGQIGKAVNLPVIQEFAKSCFYFMFYGTQIIPHIVTSGLKINLCEGLYFKAKNNNEQEKFVNNVKIGALQGIFGGTNIEYIELRKFLPEININGTNYAYLNTYLNETYNNLDVECYLDMFMESRIDQSPVLPATQMKKGCYYRMFYKCGYLKLIPQLYIEETADECCYQMFYEASNGIIPKYHDLRDKLQIIDRNGSRLSSNNDTLKKNCYYKMFFNCLNLYNTPLIIGGNKAEDESCYQMFYNCTFMVEPPQSIKIQTMSYQSCYQMFYNCVNVHHIPEMHVNTTAKNCCYEMFYLAGSITNNVNIYMNGDSRLSSNSDTLKENCYYQMFYGSKIKEGPTYIGGNVAEKTSCYQMFMNCKSMTTPPQSINIKTMNEYSCYRMFYDCSSVHHMPEMHVDTTAFECCREMFWRAGYNVTDNNITINMLGNSSLSSNSDTLAENCYYQMFYDSKINKGPTYIGGNESEKWSCYQMFYNCISMTTPPQSINIKKMAYQSCYKMFYNCSNVHHIPEMHIDTTAFECCREMFCRAGYNVANNITIDMLGNSSLSSNSDTLAKNCYYQMFYGSNITNGPAYINGNDSEETSCYQMFMNCKSMVSTPAKIEIHKVAKQSCYQMFYDCGKLQSISNIYINDSAEECCYQMFYHAGNNQSNNITLSNITLVTGNNSLGKQAFKEMFIGCTKIKNISSVSPVIIGSSTSSTNLECCMSMFKGCTLLIDVPVLNPTTLATSCYQSMFEGCTSLITIPNSLLPATTLATSCYESMFEGCTSLAGITNDSLTNSLLCASTLKDRCYANMFKGCIGLVDAPVLPAETLVSQCYDHMFTGCSNLRSITALFLTAPMNELNASPIKTDEAVANSTDQWVEGVPTHVDNNNNYINDWEEYTNNYSKYTSNEIEFNNLVNHEGDVIPVYTFIRNDSATWDVRNNIGVDGIPENWKIYNNGDNANRLSPVFIFFYSNSNRNFEDYSKLLYGFAGDDCTNKIPKYDVNYISSVYYSNGTLVKPNEFVRRGYAFGGWKNEENDTNPEGDITYNNGQYSALSFSGQDKHYFAKWTAMEYPISWYYFVNDLFTTTNGVYDTPISNYTPSMPDINDPIPTHHYPNRDGYIFIGWNSQTNQRTENFYRDVNDIDTNGDLITKSSNLVGYVGVENGQNVNENIFYAVWKYIVKWNVNSDYNEGYYTPDSNNNIVAEYYYQNNYLYNDALVFPTATQTPNNNNKYRFGGWATYNGPVGNNPYLPDMYNDNIQDIYTSIKNCTDAIPTSQKSYNVTKPKNYYATWRYEIIWYGYQNNTTTTINYGYYNDHASNYKPSTNPTMTGRVFIGWNSEQNQREDNLANIIVHDSGSDDNTIYPVWKYGIIWYTRSTNSSNQGYYNSSQIDNINYFENRYEYYQLYGDSLVYPSKNPTRDDEDYKFVGWADYAGPTSEIWQPNISGNYTVTDSDTFYAVYQSAITWHYFENTTKTYGYFNDYVKNYKPSNPSRDRYIFIGWNSDNYQRADNIDNKKIANPSQNHIYAVWKYSVKWYTNGGSYSNTGNGYYQNYYYQDNYLYNDNIIKPASNPTRNDYEFAGWSVNQSPSSNTIWKEDTDITNQTKKIIDSIDVYSVWKSAIYWYDYNGILLATTYGYYNDNVTNYKPADPSRTGYTFNGWNTSSGQTANNVKVGNPSNNKFYAVYSAIQCTIYWYDYDGSTLLATTTGDYDSPVSSHTPNNPTREGYTFQGWNTNTNQTSGNIDNIRVKTSGNNFYAAYTVNSYSIIFKLGDSNYTYINSSGTTAISIKPNYGTRLGDAVNPWPTAKGSSQYKDTTRWKKEGTTEEVYSTDYVYGNMTLVPINGNLHTFTVTFKIAGSGYTSVSKSSVERSYGAEIGTLPTASGNSQYQDTSEWEENGSPVYSTTRVYRDMILTPKNGSPSQNIVTWRINYEGGTDPEASTVAAGSSVNAPSVSRPGWNCTGWKDGNGITISFPFYPTSDITLYAQWSETPMYTITFIENHPNGSPITRNVEQGQQLTDIPTVTWNNKHSFMRWSSNIDGSGTKLEGSYTPTGNDTWYAQWTNDWLWFKVKTGYEDDTYYFSKVIQWSNEDRYWSSSHEVNDGKSYIYALGNSISNGTWKTFLRANPNESFSTNYGHFSVGTFIFSGNSNAKIEVGGNPLSLLPGLPYGGNVDYDDIDITNYNGEAINSIFSKLFMDLTVLTDAQQLVMPSKMTFQGCWGMFHGCTSLTSAPSLPATTLASSCYKVMFSDCTSLTTAPSLPATTLGPDCYREMFKGCTSLTNAPYYNGDYVLPATELEDGCYQSMFYGCTSLTTAPILPAETLVTRCYHSMFYNCHSLNSITCYAKTIPNDSMCTYDWVAGNHHEWEGVNYGVAVDGDFYIASGMLGWVKFASDSVPYNWEVHGLSSYNVTFTVIDTEYNHISRNSNYSVASVVYQGVVHGTTLAELLNDNELPEAVDTDNMYWPSRRWKIKDTNTEVTIQYTVTSNIILVPILGDLKYTITYHYRYYENNELKTRTDSTHPNTTITLPSPTRDCFIFGGWYTNTDFTGDALTGSYTPSGNVELYAKWTLKDYFKTTNTQGDNSSWKINLNINTRSWQDIKYAILPSQEEMNVDGWEPNWKGINIDNTEITETTEIDFDIGNKTIIWKGTWRPGNQSTGGYHTLGIGKMTFSNGYIKISECLTSLLYSDNFTQNSPINIDGGEEVFATFFAGNSLVNAGDLKFPNNVSESCYSSMFSSCTALTIAPNLPATTLAQNCYHGMFEWCTSLVNAPELPATTLAEDCYNSMFNRCTALTTAPTLPATTLAEDCYEYMFSNCTSLETAPALPAPTLAKSCYEYMFSGCTALTTAPDLPATTLAIYCYCGMFSGCTALTTSPELLAETLVTGCYHRMFHNCSSLNSITCCAKTGLVMQNTNDWVYGVSSSGTFTRNSEASIENLDYVQNGNENYNESLDSETKWVRGIDGIPDGWNVRVYGATTYTVTWNVMSGKPLTVPANAEITTPQPWEVESGTILSNTNTVAGDYRLVPFYYPTKGWVIDPTDWTYQPDGEGSYFSIISYPFEVTRNITFNAMIWGDDTGIIIFSNETNQSRDYCHKPIFRWFNWFGDGGDETEKYLIVDVEVIEGYYNLDNKKYLQTYSESNGQPTGNRVSKITGMAFNKLITWEEFEGGSHANPVNPTDPTTGGETLTPIDELNNPTLVTKTTRSSFWVTTPNVYDATIKIKVTVTGVGGNATAAENETDWNAILEEYPNPNQRISIFTITTCSQSSGGSSGTTNNITIRGNYSYITGNSYAQIAVTVKGGTAEQLDGATIYLTGPESHSANYTGLGAIFRVQASSGSTGWTLTLKNSSGITLATGSVHSQSIDPYIDPYI